MTKGMVGKQKGGKKLQDTMDVNIFNDRSLDTDNYSSAHCHHRYLLPIDISTDDININMHNNQYREDYRVSGYEGLEWQFFFPPSIQTEACKVYITIVDICLL